MLVLEGTSVVQCWSLPMVGMLVFGGCTLARRPSRLVLVMGVLSYISTSAPSHHLSTHEPVWDEEEDEDQDLCDGSRDVRAIEAEEEAYDNIAYQEEDKTACVEDALLEEYLFGEEDAAEEEDAFVEEQHGYGG